MSIRLKLIILFLLIAILPSLLINIVTFNNYKNSLVADRFSALQNLSAFKADKVEAYFSGLRSAIQSVQGSYIIKKELPVLFRFAGAPESPEFMDAKKMLDGTLPGMAKAFGLVNLVLAGPDGLILYASNPAHYRQNLLKPLSGLEPNTFEEGRKDIYLSDIFLDKVNDNRPGVFLSAPIVDFEGSFSGVLVFELDMQSVYNIVQDKTGLGKTGEVLLGRKRGNEAEFLNPLRHEPDAALKKRVPLGEELAQPVQKAVQGSTGAGELTDYRGKRVIAAWRHLPDLGWGMVAKIDSDEAFAEVHRLSLIGTFIMIIGSVLSALAAFIFAQSISGPLKKLVKGVQVVGKGDLDHKIGLDQKDEIGQLSSAFDKMTQDLKEITVSRDELNKEVLERKEVEEALKESEEKFRSAFAHAAIGFAMAAPDGAFVDANSAYCAITGYTIDELRNLKFSQLVYPEDLEENNRLVERMLAGEIPGSVIENRYSRRDGTVIWVTKSISLVRDAEGAPKWIIALVEDITARKQAEEGLIKSRDELEERVQERTQELSEERKRLFSVMETLPVYVILLTPDYHVSFANKFFRERFGEDRGRCCFDYLFKRGTPCDNCETYKVMKTNAPHHWEWTGPDNRNYDIYDFPFIEADGSTHIMEMGIDVTERKKAEEVLEKARDLLEARVKERTDELAEANKQLRSEIEEREKIELALRQNQEDLNRAQSVAHVGSWRLNLQDNLLLWSEENHRIFGIPEGAAMTYETFISSIHPDDRSFVDQKWKAALKGELYDIEHRIIVHGEIKWVRERAELELDKDGKLLGGFGTTMDITGLKRAEEVLKRDKETLEKLVNEKSLEMVALQAEADRAKRLADIGTLAATVAHELRNPLAAIKMASYNIKRKAQNPALDSHLANIETKLSESEQIISNLLFYSRIKPPHVARINLYNIINACISDVSNEPSQSSVRLERNIEPIKDLLIEADPLQMKEVFSNILNNAFDALEQKEGVVEIKAGNVDGKIMVSIRDSGVGIEEENLSRIFEPFFTTKAKGTGLGLAVCHQIVSLHNGSICIESRKNVGTTVTVSLLL